MQLSCLPASHKISFVLRCIRQPVNVFTFTIETVIFIAGTTVCRADIMLQSDHFVVFIPAVTIHSTCVLKQQEVYVEEANSLKYCRRIASMGTRFMDFHFHSRSNFPVVSYVFLLRVKIDFLKYANNGVTPWCSWLRCCRKVPGSIPDGVIGIFRWHNSSPSTMALGLTQPLTEMSTRNISWGVKAVGV